MPARPQLDYAGKVALAADDLEDVLDITIGFDVHLESSREIRLTRDEWLALFERFGLDPELVPAAIKPEAAWRSALRAAKVKDVEGRRVLPLLERGVLTEAEVDVAYEEVYFEQPIRREDGSLFARLVRKRKHYQAGTVREKRPRGHDYELVTVTSVAWHPKAPSEWLPDPHGVDAAEFPEYPYAELLEKARLDWIERRDYYDGTVVGSAITRALNAAGGYITKPSGGTWLIPFDRANLALLEAIEQFRDALIAERYWRKATEEAPVPTFEFAFIPIAGIPAGVRRVRKWVEDRVVADLHAVIASLAALRDGEAVPTVAQLVAADAARDQAVARLSEYGDEVAAEMPPSVTAVLGELAAVRAAAAARRKAPAKAA